MDSWRKGGVDSEPPPPPAAQLWVLMINSKLDP